MGKINFQKHHQSKFHLQPRMKASKISMTTKATDSKVLAPEALAISVKTVDPVVELTKSKIEKSFAIEPMTKEAAVPSVASKPYVRPPSLVLNSGTMIPG